MTRNRKPWGNSTFVRASVVSGTAREGYLTYWTVVTLQRPDGRYAIEATGADEGDLTWVVSNENDARGVHDEAVVVIGDFILDDSSVEHYDNEHAYLNG